MPKVQKLNVENLSYNDYTKCKSLNFRTTGMMLDELVIARNYPYSNKGRVYMLKDNDEKLLAWAIVTRDKVNFYTRKSERRKGYGKQLLKAISKEHDVSVLTASMHDNISESFYDGTNFKKEWK